MVLFQAINQTVPLPGYKQAKSPSSFDAGPELITVEPSPSYRLISCPISFTTYSSNRFKTRHRPTCLHTPLSCPLHDPHHTTQSQTISNFLIATLLLLCHFYFRLADTYKDLEKLTHFHHPRILPSNFKVSHSKFVARTHPHVYICPFPNRETHHSWLFDPMLLSQIRGAT